MTAPGLVAGTPGVIRVLSGALIDVFNPAPASIAIGDIARGLSHLARFNGQTSTFYSVAQHSVLVAALVADRLRAAGRPEEDVASLALCGLLHDGAEAYLGDLVRPIKQHPAFAAWGPLEARIHRVILDRFGLVGLELMPGVVTWADDLALELEGAALVDGWSLRREWLPALSVTPVGSTVAEAQFVRMFAELRAAIVGWADAFEVEG